MAAAPKIASCILKLFDEQLMPDTSIVAGGKEIRAHKAVLVATSGFFREHFRNGGSDKIEVKEPYKAVRALIRFLYFGSLAESDLGPEDGLDLLASSRDYGIDVMADDDVVDLIVPQLTLENCIPVLLHPELVNHAYVIRGVCEFTGTNFFKLIQRSTLRMQLLTIRKNFFIEVLKVICRSCDSEANADLVVQFCLEYFHIDNACDLLRDCKQWQWMEKLDVLTKMRNPKEVLKQSEPQQPQPGFQFKEGMNEEEIFAMLDKNNDGVITKEEFQSLKQTMQTLASYTYFTEWTIPNIKAALEGEPLCSLSCGEFFEWRVRVDNGAEGKLRIVYEDVIPKHASAVCCRRFPAATFAWKVKFRGEEIFNDRPVFITFAERVSLHWSTTLGLDSTLLTDDDELTISVTMTENPLLSLILYFLSSNVKNVDYAEDILNRLPHIEYRCLSSFFIFRHESRPQSATLGDTQPVPQSP